MDDQIEGAEHLNKIIEEVEQLKGELPCAILFPYKYSFDALGNCRVAQYRERLFFNKSKFEWRNRVHEVVIFKEANSTFTQTREEIVWIHNREGKVTESNRNLRIMKKVITEMEESGNIDARQYYYAMLEHFNGNESDRAIELGNKYIALSGWSDELVMACQRLGIHYLSTGKFKDAIEICLKSLQYKENWAETYFIIGKAFCMWADTGHNSYENYQKSISFIKQGLSYPPTKTLLFIDPMDRKYEVYKFLLIAYTKLGDFDAALESASKGLEANPQDIWFKENRKQFQQHLTRLKFNKEVKELLDCERINQESYNKIMAVLDNPDLINLNKSENVDIFKFIDSIRESNYVYNCFQEDSGKIKTHLSIGPNNETPLDIIFFIGNGFEDWTSETIKKTGLGGSELMAAEIGRGLAALGHRVRIFNSCGKTGEGIYEGVEYLHTDKFKNLTCDVLIVSRMAHMLDEVYNIQSKLTIAWAHDVVLSNTKHKLLLRADKIFALSEWHKQNLMREHNLHNDHVLVTRNGIHPERFLNKNVKRNPYKIVQSSSPDRSWATILDCWDKIKKNVPQAELHLFYGFHNWEQMAKVNPQYAAPALALRDRVLAMKDQGVHFHGRVSQDRLAEEFLSAGIWVAPTWFSETSCISAMEAQCAGNRVVCSDLAALSETVQHGVKIPGDCFSQEYRKIFIDEVVGAMEMPGDEDRIEAQKWASETFSLKNLAKDWQSIFLNLIDKKKTHPCLPYQPTIHYK
jgi:glycosyltransferase involved in cell wall biosynthesis